MEDSRATTQPYLLNRDANDMEQSKHGNGLLGAVGLDGEAEAMDDTKAIRLPTMPGVEIEEQRVT